MTRLTDRKPSASSRFAFADGLRGLAAMWVILFHMSEGRHLEVLRAEISAIYKYIFSAGHLGVPIFFVLSGFVMAYTTRNEIINLTTATKFVVRRLVRLTPAYYFSIFLLLALLFVKSKTVEAANWAVDPWVLVAHLFFLQGILRMESLNPVYWTLCVEVQFYIAFAALLLCADKCAAYPAFESSREIFLLSSAMLALLWPLGVIKDPIWAGGFLPHWYTFMLGVLTWMVLDERRKITTIFSILYISFVLLLSFYLNMWFGFIAAITALALILSGWTGSLGSWLSSPSVQALGLISYSLYLLHNPLTGAVFRITGKIVAPGLTYEVIGMTLTIAICLFFSWVAYVFIERPSIDFSRRIGSAKG